MAMNRDNKSAAMMMMPTCLSQSRSGTRTTHALNPSKGRESAAFVPRSRALSAKGRRGRQLRRLLHPLAIPAQRCIVHEQNDLVLREL